LYYRFINLVVSRPLPILLATLLLTGWFAWQLPSIRTDSDARSYLGKDDPVGQALDRMEDIFGEQDLFMILVLRRDHRDGIYNPSTLALIREIGEWLEQQDEYETSLPSDLRSLATVNNIVGSDSGLLVLPFMDEIPTNRDQSLALRRVLDADPVYSESLVSADGKGATIMVRRSAAGGLSRRAASRKLEAYVNKLSADGHPETFHLTGRPIIEGIFDENMRSDTRNMLPAVVGLIGIMLWLTFRSVRGVLLPFAVILGTEMSTMGALAALDHPIYPITTILPVILVPIAVADSIHFLSRYYDAQVENPSLDREAVVRLAMQEMTFPVMLTSITTAVGFSAMSVSRLIPIFEFGLAAAGGIMVALLLTLVLMPAVLMLLPLQPGRGRSRNGLLDRGSWLVRQLTGSAVLVNRNPWATLALFALLSSVGVFGIRLVTADSSMVSQFPPGHRVRAANNVADLYFAGGTTTDILIDSGSEGGLKNPALLKAMASVQDGLEEMEMVGDSFSLADLVARMHAVMNGLPNGSREMPANSELVAQYLLLYSMSGSPGDFDDLVDYDYRYARLRTFLRDPGTTAARQVLKRSDELVSLHFADLPNTSAVAAGGAQFTTTLEEAIISGQLLTAAICLPVLVAIGFLVFRSLVMALLLVAPVAFAVLLTYGALGIAGIPTDFGIAVLSGITLGIGVDFSVHYLHRYRELRNRGMEHEGASVLTAATAGRALFFNAVVLAGGFLVLLGARFYPQVKLGLLVTTTMVICYVYTMYLFPAALGLFAADKSSTVEGPS